VSDEAQRRPSLAFRAVPGARGALAPPEARSLAGPARLASGVRRRHEASLGREIPDAPVKAPPRALPCPA